MNTQDFKRATPPVPQHFVQRRDETLERIVNMNKNMHRSIRRTVCLVAAAVLLLAGAGIAATKLGIFDFLTDKAEPIVPLPGAEEMVGTNLGTTENAYVTLNVEEAVFDGQSVLVKMRITPKDTQRYAMFNSFMQDSTDEFETTFVPDEVPEGTQELGGMKIVNENGVQQLWKNGAEVEIPASAEEAQEKGYEVYRMDGKLYYANQMALSVIPRENSRERINYWQRMEFPDGEMVLGGGDADGQEDGSVVIWMDASSDKALDQDAIRVQAGAVIADPEGNEIPLEPVTLTLPRSEEVKHVRLEPAGDGAGDHFRIYGGEISFTKLRGYIKLRYSCDLDEEAAPMGISFSFYDKEGNSIPSGSGTIHSLGENVHELNLEIQSFDPVPDTIIAQAKIIGGEVIPGRIECRLVAE